MAKKDMCPRSPALSHCPVQADGLSRWEIGQGGAEEQQGLCQLPPPHLPFFLLGRVRGWQEGAGKRMQEWQSPNSLHSPSQALTQETPPQDRTPGVSRSEPQSPDILPLPEHLQLNRKQRNDSWRQNSSKA